MKVLIIDLETTGLKPEQHQVIEFGAILFDCRTHSILEQISALIPCADNGAKHINQIAPEASQQSIVYAGAITHLLEMAAIADYVTAWNIEFDIKWFGHPNQELPSLDTPCFDAMGVKYARSGNSKKLIDVALAHGIPVVSAHRALTDCQILAELFRRHRNIEALINQAIAAESAPKALVRADISYECREMAKAKGFRWDDKIPRAWSRVIPTSEIDSLGFPVTIIEETSNAA